MRLIDADALIEFCAERWIPLNIDAVNMQPTIQPEKAQLSQEGQEGTTKGTTSDLISRQQALSKARCVEVDGGVAQVIPVSDIQKLPTIQPVATDTNVGDTISRQQAIDALDCINGVEEVLRSLPTAQPSPQWILCDERMPEEHEWLGTKKFGTTISDEVYVTFENEKGERFCQHMKFQNGELSRYDQFHMDTWFKGSKPIAWMPLPEHYKGG